MPLTDQLTLLVICVAFVGFAAVLTWADLRTGSPKR